MLDLSTLWRMPISARWASVEGKEYIVFKCEVSETLTYTKPMLVQSKFATSIKHARGFRSASKTSDVRRDLYKLLVCHTPITLTPVEVEQDTTPINQAGEPDKPWTMYTYFLAMIQRFLTEVANEQQKNL